MSKAKHEPKALPKRFYEHAGFEMVEGYYTITLDGKQVRTPARHLLQVSRQPIAAAIAQEWNTQKDVIDTNTMPLTRLAHIALDRIAQDRALLLEDIAHYIETDLLYYRAPLAEANTPLAADNHGLRAKQDAVFDAILQWVNTAYDAHFAITEGIVPVAQPDASVAKIAAVFAAANDDELAALAMMVPMLGSALLALTLWKGHIPLEQGLEAARLDEDAQAARWGEDPLAAAAWSAKARDIRAAVFYLTGK